MLKALIVSVLCASVVGSSSTLNLFQTDYDADAYAVTPITFAIPADVPEGWYPLRAVSEYLPIEVSWDGVNQEVVVVSEAVRQVRPLTAERRFKASRLPPNLCIKRGVTYCSPQFLTGMLPGISFRHEDQVYSFNGESVNSETIQGNKRFRSWCLTALYRMKLLLPEDYEFIRNHLKGIVLDDGYGEFPVSANAYIYLKKAVCHIMDRTAYGGQLAGYIAHEAYHVWQYKNDEPIEERPAKVYADTIVSTFVYSK